MNELPVDLAPPLHLMESAGLSPWWLLLPPFLAFLISRWLRNRRTQEAPATTAPPSTAPTAHPPGLVEQIDALQAQFKGKSGYRRGCHKLADLLRQNLEGSRTLTAREIVATLGEAGLSKIFPLLAELQFGREEPRRSDFSGICELAQETVREGTASK